MKALLRYTFPAMAMVLFFSCGKKPALSPVERDSLALQIKQLEKVAVTAVTGDSLVNVWMKLDKNPAIARDTVLAVKVYYNLARLYGMRGLDSAQLFVEKALELIEPTNGNLEDKALVYNGIGNIRSMEASSHEANYYYNKAAAIVLSDSTVDLSAEAKSVMLLSAAQSNRMTFQYDLAEKMTRAALPFADALPEGHTNHQRVLVQMIQIMNMLKEPPDSIAPYLQKLEALHKAYPGQYNVSFLYESKLKYFELMPKKDSLLHYQLLKAALDQAHYEADPNSAPAINNLFIDYCNAGGTYVALRQAARAEEMFREAKILLTDHKDLIYADNATIYQNNLAALYQMQGKKDEAIALLFQTSKLQKDIYQTENTQAVAEMNALYQLQAKDRSIRTLNESIRINRLQLQKNRLWLAVSALGVVLLGVTLLFFYYRSRQRRLNQEREKVLLQQQLLRTQMEPHFIFNTLSAVQSFVRLDKKESAIKYLNRFSRLLRSSLELSRENLVPLDEEIETLENYLSLQQMRFEGAFTYKIEQPMEQDLSAVLLPPMLLQPYVENAILHGIELDKGTGNIDIRLQLQQDILLASITDSGKTQSHETDPTHRSLSGTISRERMQFLGKKAGIHTAAAPGGGTVITLHIPVMQG